MNKSIFKKGLTIACTLAVALPASQSLADWYGAQPGRNRSQGYGDFPPPSIERDLNRSRNVDNQPADTSTQDYRDLNPWDNNYQPVPRRNPNYQAPNYTTPNYPPQNYTAPIYPQPYSGGYDRRSSNSPFGGSSPGFSSPWNNRGSSFEGPWNDKGSSFSPWSDRDSRGGNRNPFGNRGTDDWFDPNKGSMSRNWDDMLNAPSRSGEMPGGWTAPSISAPNPVDVGDEFDDAARDLPDQMDNFQWDDNRRRSYR